MKDGLLKQKDKGYDRDTGYFHNCIICLYNSNHKSSCHWCLHCVVVPVVGGMRTASRYQQYNAVLFEQKRVTFLIF